MQVIARQYWYHCAGSAAWFYCVKYETLIPLAAKLYRCSFKLMVLHEFNISLTILSFLTGKIDLALSLLFKFSTQGAVDELQLC